jgi:uncharacterized protein (UPF0262 family)
MTDPCLRHQDRVAQVITGLLKLSPLRRKIADCGLPCSEYRRRVGSGIGAD